MAVHPGVSVLRTYKNEMTKVMARMLLEQLLVKPMVLQRKPPSSLSKCSGVMVQVLPAKFFLA